MQNAFLHLCPLHLLLIGVADRVKGHFLTMIATPRAVRYLLSTHFCTCWKRENNLESFQVYKSLTKKKKSSEVVILTFAL